MSVRDLLTRHGLEAYIDAFEAQYVAVDDLRGLSDKDLMETFGMRPFADRRRFRALVESLAGPEVVDPGATRAGPALDDPGATRAGPALDDPGATRAGPALDDPGATRMGSVPADAGATRMAPGAASASPSAGTAEPSVGDKLLGRYYLVKELGRGAMGIVYRAVDELTQADVAVKRIVPEHSASRAALDRFLEEAATAQQLSHPNLLRINHVEGGATPFLVMEYVDGDTLTVAWMQRQRRYPLSELRPVLAQVLEGLAYLHARGVVHRDVKPDNVLLGRNGDVKLADYGISTTLRAQRHGGTAAGTPLYMAPEQLRGEPCDGRADLYAVGVMAYQLATGRLPFDASSAEVARAWHFGRSRPSDTGDAGFDGWLAKLWNPDAKNRFSSAAQAATELRAGDPGAVEEREAVARDLAIVEGVAERLRTATGLNQWSGSDDRVDILRPLGRMRTKVGALRALELVRAFAGEHPNAPIFKATYALVGLLGPIAGEHSTKQAFDEHRRRVFGPVERFFKASLLLAAFLIVAVVIMEKC
jgi:hypothetical protein